MAGELTLNDNDNPAALDIGAYFNAGGDGNDLTIYLQTLDGEVSFTAAAQYILGGGGFARFTLPADAQTLLNNLSTGDRWIFKAARPAASDTVTANADATQFSISNPEATGVTTTSSSEGYQIINLDAAWWGQLTGSQRGWEPPTADRPAIVSGLALNAGETLVAFGIYSSGVVRISLDTGDLTDAFEADGGVRLTVGSQSWIFLLAGADMGVPYFWSPSNSDEVIEAYGIIASATAGTLEISDDPDTDFADTSSVAPSFADIAGDPQDWVRGQAITTVQVPAASGMPTPTYAVVGPLPAGLSFDSNTRQITGTPTVVGSGSIRIRASNSAGFDEWIFFYTISGQSITANADASAFSISNPEATGTATGTVTVITDSLTANADPTAFSISNPEAAGTVTQVPETITTNADPTALSISNPETAAGTV